MSRPIIAAAFIAAVASCGSGELGIEAVPPVVNEQSAVAQPVDEHTETLEEGLRVEGDASDPKPGWFRVAGGLTCPTEVSEHSVFEYAENAAGAATLDDATRLWWTEGQGASRGDRAELTESVDRSAATYSDADGQVILKLGFFRGTGGWLLGTKISCAD